MSTSVAQPIEGPLLTPQQAERLVSLDVFRGMTIAAMITVNNPGTWDHVYRPLMHATWNGWTFADVIFPFFLFIVGVAITLSLAGRVARSKSQRGIILQILRRALILFALGLLLNDFPYFDNLSKLRILGVLQRIGLCYFLAALIFIKTDVREQVGMTLALLTGYWLLMTLVPVPGYGAGVLAKEGNLVAYVDNLLLPGHLYQPKWDPEGLLSTIPAVATTLLGVLTGHWLRSSRSMDEKVLGLLVMGIVGVLIGEIMGIWFPINKNLWTSSYVVFTGGMALVCLCACYWLVDGKGYKRLATPFIVFGVNPITVYVLSSLVGQLLNLYQLARPDGTLVSLKTAVYENYFASWAGPLNGSLLFALAYVLMWLVPMTVLYHRRIFIRI